MSEMLFLSHLKTMEIINPPLPSKRLRKPKRYFQFVCARHLKRKMKPSSHIMAVSARNINSFLFSDSFSNLREQFLDWKFFPCFSQRHHLACFALFSVLTNSLLPGTYFLYALVKLLFIHSSKTKMAKCTYATFFYILSHFKNGSVVFKANVFKELK